VIEHQNGVVSASYFECGTYLINMHLFRQFMHLSGGIQELWLHGNLGYATELLSRDIVLNGKSHGAYANRALVQARWQKWGDALVDAEVVSSHASSRTRR